MCTRLAAVRFRPTPPAFRLTSRTVGALAAPGGGQLEAASVKDGADCAGLVLLAPSMCRVHRAASAQQPLA